MTPSDGASRAALLVGGGGSSHSLDFLLSPPAAFDLLGPLPSNRECPSPFFLVLYEEVVLRGVVGGFRRNNPATSVVLFDLLHLLLPADVCVLWLL